MKTIEEMAEDAAPPQGRTPTFHQAQERALERSYFIRGFITGFHRRRSMARDVCTPYCAWGNERRNKIQKNYRKTG